MSTNITNTIFTFIINKNDKVKKIAIFQFINIIKYTLFQDY